MTLRDLITARQIVDSTDVVALFEDWIQPRRADGTVEVRGRRRVLSVRTLLLAMAATAIDGREMHIVRLTKTINSWTEDDQHQALKIPEKEASKLPTITHRQVSELWNQIADQVTASEHFASPKLPAGLSKAKKQDLLATRNVRLQQGCDLILDGSLAASPDSPDTAGSTRPDPAWETGHYVVDWTFLPSWAAKRPRNIPSPDPDASWVSIPGHAYDLKWHLFGYKVHALVRTRTPGGARVPYVVERLALDHASSQSKKPVLDLVRRMNPLTPGGLPSAARKVRELVADRGYSKNGASDWAAAACAMR